MGISSKEIRETFLKFFQDNDHLLIGGSSVIPKNDPTLLFINSGMAPLKPYFLGKETPPKKTLCNIQPCIRTNDIDEVGDRHHLTMFEMLGSWSIGDYYKEKACALAYDLLVNYFKFPPEKLYVTVYHGNKDLGLPADKESIDAWLKVGVPRDHIVELGEDNFWGPAGTTGPCGPCTEVFYDTGEEFGPTYKPGGEFDDKSRYIEIWNAGVFMEFNKNADGSFTPLPLKSVDTGSGLERMTMVMNQAKSVYETDMFMPIIEKIESVFDGELTIREKRIIADHLRSSCLIIAEGVPPSNEGQGYIPRKLIRKFVSLLMHEEDLVGKTLQVVETVLDKMSDISPVITKNKKSVCQEFKTEIEEFLPIVQKGLKILEEKFIPKSAKELSGLAIFEGVTTYGVPIEVLKEYAEKHSLKFDMDGYEKLFQEHREVSRSQGAGDDAAVKKVLATLPKTKFLGYQEQTCKGSVLQVFRDGSPVDKLNEGESGWIVFDQTTIYGESGGQEGDSGKCTGPSACVAIDNAKKVDDIIIHEVTIKKGNVKAGDTFEMKYDLEKRLQSRRNHSATHLLNAVLRDMYGTQTKQKGSSVNDKRLRFDFNLDHPVSKEDIQKIETTINNWILEDYRSNTEVKSFDQAKESGVVLLEGEDYGDDVRVVTFGDVSSELCGGTHVESTGEIGLFTIESESSIAKGIRRIEAITSEQAIKKSLKNANLVREAAQLLAVKPDKLIESIAKLKEKSTKSKNVEEAARLDEVFALGDESCRLKLFKSSVGGKSIREKTQEILDKDKLAVACSIYFAEKTTVAVFANKSLAKKLPSNEFVKPILGLINGKGGGKPEFSQGGGDKVEDEKAFLGEIKTLLEAKYSELTKS